MIVKSYLVYPTNGFLEQASALLSQMAQCEIIPATNENVIVLVTESADETADSALEAEIRALPHVQALTLVTGHKES